MSKPKKKTEGKKSVIDIYYLIMKYLLGNGADADLSNGSGQTARSIAEGKKNPKVMALFK